MLKIMTSRLEKRKKAQILSCFFFSSTPRGRVVAGKQKKLAEKSSSYPKWKQGHERAI